MLVGVIGPVDVSSIPLNSSSTTNSTTYLYRLNLYTLLEQMPAGAWVWMASFLIAHELTVNNPRVVHIDTFPNSHLDEICQLFCEDGDFIMEYRKNKWRVHNLKPCNYFDPTLSDVYKCQDFIIYVVYMTPRTPLFTPDILFLMWPRHLCLYLDHNPGIWMSLLTG